MTVPGIWGVERYGRRRLLLVGAIGMTICEFIIAIIGSTTSQSNQSAQSAEVAFVCFYIAFFASTWGPITWVITGEIFPLKVRAKAMSLSVASNWLWNWAIAYSSEFSSRFAGERSGTILIRIYSAVHGRLWPRKLKPRNQCVLHLGLDVCLLYPLRLLLHSGNKGSLSRADRPAVPERRTRSLGLVPQATPRGGCRALGSQGQCLRCWRQQGR